MIFVHECRKFKLAIGYTILYYEPILDRRPKLLHLYDTMSTHKKKISVYSQGRLLSTPWWPNNLFILCRLHDKRLFLLSGFIITDPDCIPFCKIKWKSSLINLILISVIWTNSLIRTLFLIRITKVFGWSRLYCTNNFPTSIISEAVFKLLNLFELRIVSLN